MENEPKFDQPENIQPESGEVLNIVAEKLRGLIESLGLRETEEMAGARARLAQEWSMEVEIEYHRLGEAVADEAEGDTTRIALILQMALLQAEAGQAERALDNFADAIEYADNIMDEDLGDEIHAIRKMLGWKK